MGELWICFIIGMVIGAVIVMIEDTINPRTISYREWQRCKECGYHIAIICKPCSTELSKR